LTLSQTSLKIKFIQQEDGSLAVAFPDASIVETEEGPMMGFYCDANSAVFIGGAIVHAGFDMIEQDSEDEDGNIDISRHYEE